MNTAHRHTGYTEVIRLFKKVTNSRAFNDGKPNLSFVTKNLLMPSNRFFFLSKIKYCK